MWNERYSEPGYAFGETPNDFLVSVADRIPSGKILSIGEGEGRNAVFLASRGYQVSAVDASAVGLQKAHELAEKNKVEISTEVMDLADFDPGKNQWQGVVSIFCHIPIDIRHSLYRRLIDSLVPGGVFVLESYTPDQLKFATGGPPTADLMMTVDALREELSGLQLEIAHEIERDVIEGRYHHGRAAVVQTLGFKK